jgi:hypothetical protein
VQRLILAVFVVYGEGDNLAIVGAWFFEHPYYNASYILLFLSSDKYLDK